MLVDVLIKLAPTLFRTGGGIKLNIGRRCPGFPLFPGGRPPAPPKIESLCCAMSNRPKFRKMALVSNSSVLAPSVNFHTFFSNSSGIRPEFCVDYYDEIGNVGYYVMSLAFIFLILSTFMFHMMSSNADEHKMKFYYKVMFITGISALAYTAMLSAQVAPEACLVKGSSYRRFPGRNRGSWLPTRILHSLRGLVHHHAAYNSCSWSNCRR